MKHALCPHCSTTGGLSINGDKALWICPEHGTFQSIDKSKLNGQTGLLARYNKN